MNYKTLLTGLIISTISVSAFAGHDNHHYKRHKKFQSSNHFFDYGRVKSVTPIVETVEHRIPRETCRQERVRFHNRSNAAPVILGSIIGAVIGNQLGHHKSNKKVGAVAGTLLGAAIGSDISNHSTRHHNEYRMETQCSREYDVELEEQVIGYDVEYRYKGNTYYTQTREHPGKKLQLKLRIQPVIS